MNLSDYRQNAGYTGTESHIMYETKEPTKEIWLWIYDHRIHWSMAYCTTQKLLASQGDRMAF